jgi:hypothetical protein
MVISLVLGFSSLVIITGTVFLILRILVWR